MTATTQHFGGNIVRTFDGAPAGRRDYADSPYVYFAHRTRPGEALRIEGLRSLSVYVFAGSDLLEVQDMGAFMQKGDVLQVEDRSVHLKAGNGETEVLVAGVREPSGLPPAMTITRASDVKRVTKPWGFELWLTGEHPVYAFKHIVIRQGFRTSLQYHQLKRETNVLMEGQARCFYKIDAGQRNDDVQETDVGSFTLDPVGVLDVHPGTLHRIEALTNITLCEVSTPHLDDVIRVIDDAKRTHGRIQEEHRGERS